MYLCARPCNINKLYTPTSQPTTQPIQYVFVYTSICWFAGEQRCNQKLQGILRVSFAFIYLRFKIFMWCLSIKSVMRHSECCSWAWEWVSEWGAITRERVLRCKICAICVCAKCIYIFPVRVARRIRTLHVKMSRLSSFRIEISFVPFHFVWYRIRERISMIHIYIYWINGGTFNVLNFYFIRLFYFISCSTFWYIRDGPVTLWN